MGYIHKISFHTETTNITFAGTQQVDVHIVKKTKCKQHQLAASLDAAGSPLTLPAWELPPASRMKAAPPPRQEAAPRGRAMDSPDALSRGSAPGWRTKVILQ